MYNVTTYPNGALFSKSKDISELKLHKAQRGSQCLIGEVECFLTLEELTRRASEVPISPGILLEGKRKAANFIEGRVIVFDVDDDYSILDCTQLLNESEYEYSIYTSYSHQLSDKDKFHVIMPTASLIQNEAEYKATHAFISQQVFNNKNDSTPSSAANLFFNSNPDSRQIIVKEGNGLKQIEVQSSLPKTIVVANKATNSTAEAVTKLTKRTLIFLANGAEQGKWHEERRYAVQNMKAAGLDLDECFEKLEKITGVLTAEDKDQVKRLYKDNYQFTVKEGPHPLKIAYTDDRGKQRMIPEQEIVEHFIKDRKLCIKVNGQFVLNGIYRDPIYVLEEIRDYAQKELEQRSQISVISSALNKYVVDEKEKRFEEIKTGLRYDPTAKFNFDDLVASITGKEDALVKAIIHHFLWQVKRKMQDLPVTHHIMPVFVGTSGAGKSELIKKILDPLYDLVYWDGDFKKLVDSREAFNLTEKYVYFIDEMSKADKADVETIKKQITSKDVQYRRLGTNITCAGVNRATFIGASNVNLEQIIKDDKSARRFFQVNTLPKTDWKKINEFDYVSMWKSVDESLPCSIPAIIEQVAEAQEKIRHKSPIELFVKEFNVSQEQIKGSTKTLRKDLYRTYRTWMSEAGFNYQTNKYFFLENLETVAGPALKEKLENRIVEYYYTKQTDESSSQTEE